MYVAKVRKFGYGSVTGSILYNCQQDGVKVQTFKPVAPQLVLFQASVIICFCTK